MYAPPRPFGFIGRTRQEPRNHLSEHRARRGGRIRELEPRTCEVRPQDTPTPPMRGPETDTTDDIPHATERCSPSREISRRWGPQKCRPRRAPECSGEVETPLSLSPSRTPLAPPSWMQPPAYVNHRGPPTATVVLPARAEAARVKTRDGGGCRLLCRPPAAHRELRPPV